MSCDASEYCGCLVACVACPDLSEFTIVDPLRRVTVLVFCAIVPWIVRHVLVHGDVVPEHHVLALLFLVVIPRVCVSTKILCAFRCIKFRSLCAAFL